MDSDEILIFLYIILEIVLIEHTEEMDIELEGKNRVYLLCLGWSDWCTVMPFNKI